MTNDFDALYNIASHSPIHSHIHTPMAMSTMQPARQEQVRVRCLAHGHLDTQLGGSPEGSKSLK